MTNPSNAMLYTQAGSGVASSSGLINAIISNVSPSTTNIIGPSGPYKVGQRWVNSSAGQTYTLTSLSTSAGVTTASWVLEGDGGQGGDLQTLTGDTGGALSPTANNINILGTAGQITVSGSGSTLTLALAGGGTAIDSIALQTGTTPIAPTAGGLVTINGAVVAAGTNPVRTDGTGANTMAVEVQIAQAIAATDATKIGLCNFDSTSFAVDANGFVTLAGGGLAIDSFTPDTGTAPVVPTGSGVVTMAGTASQITTTGGTNVLTFSLPASVVAPGSLASTTSITAGNALTVTTGDVNVSGGNIFTSRSASGADVYIQAANSSNTASSRAGAIYEVGGSSAGDPFTSYFVNAVGAAAMTMGVDVSDSYNFKISNGPVLGTNDRFSLTSAGDLNIALGIWADGGNITAVNGNFVLGTAGNKIVSTSVGSSASAGANSFGTVTLVNGTVTVSTTAVTASSIIFLTRMSVGTTGANDLGILSVGTIVAATSFVINAWTVTNATALQADDQSIVGWFLVN